LQVGGARAGRRGADDTAEGGVIGARWALGGIARSADAVEWWEERKRSAKGVEG
jgi:hypothetical protein